MILTGMARLGRDAEVRQTPSGDPVCQLSLAYNYGRKGDDGKYPTTWISAALWGKRAESLAPYLVKGSQHCFVLSDLHVRTYQSKDGREGASLDARVMDVTLGPRAEGSNNAPAQAQYRSNRPPAQDCPQADQGTTDAFEDDDIPF